MHEASLARYVEFFENLSAGRLKHLDEVMTSDVYFSDPFNQVTGLTPVRRIFEHMFEQFESAKFTVTHAALAAEISASEGLHDPATTALLSWELEAVLKRNGANWKIVGMSDIRFATDGRVSQHIDHWDAAGQFYERFPIIGWVLRKIRSKLKV